MQQNIVDPRQARVFSTFPANVFLENITVDASGDLYVTSLLEGIVYKVNAQGEQQIYARIDGKPAGIVCLDDDRFLLNGWDANNIPTLFLLSAGQVRPVHQPADAQFLNGMTALDKSSILICDSRIGALFLYNLDQNTSRIWLTHPLLAKADPATDKPAANGIKVFGENVYVSNTDKKLLLRIPLTDPHTNDAQTPPRPGDPEVILNDILLDDFAIDTKGNIYAATHIHNSVIRITPQNEITQLAGEPQGLAGSTAIAFGRTPADSYCIYVTTNGGMTLPPTGGIQNARIIKLPVHIPTPSEWAGGVETFKKLTDVFYEKVLKDPILEPIFRHMPPAHAQHVAYFMTEVMQGPKVYTETYGPDALKHMVGKHIGKRLTEAQRKRWVELLMLSADEIGLAPDPEFRSAFAAHIEWGTRVAVLASQLTENPITKEDHLPQWGWGEVKGPFDAVGSVFRQNPTDID